MALLPTQRIGAYMRKMVIDGLIVYTDTTDIKEMNKELQAIGKNINQIAKRVNSVSFVDYQKYHSNKYTYRNIRKVSDKLCEEYGLSVIAENSNKGKSYKGKSYFEHTAYEKNTTYKSQLKQKIDTAIKRSTGFEDFILRMELAGDEAKRGKYISFRAQGQQRFMRSKTLGERYTEESIINRIHKSKKRIIGN